MQIECSSDLHESSDSIDIILFSCLPKSYHGHEIATSMNINIQFLEVNVSWAQLHKYCTSCE